MRKMAFVAGFAVGYVLGTKAGRERYEQLVRSAKRVREHPTVQSVAGLVEAQVGQGMAAAKDAFGRTKVGAAVMGERDTRPYETDPTHLSQGF